MASIVYARRYAQAAIDLGIEHHDLDAWRADLALLAELWSDTGLRAYLEDVRISKQARLDRARERLANHISPRAMNMVLLLITRGRTSLVPYIARHFTEIERQRDKKVVATVTSATELSPAERDTISRRLSEYTGLQVELETAIQPEILGGLVIKVGDQLLDLSVLGKLKRLREQVVGRSA
jgi:F-type H+-transporting ATPase subunit delta